MRITVKETKEATLLRLSVAVRYKDEDMPIDAPMRNGDLWEAIIDLDQHRVLDWPEGKTLAFRDMKICDEGRYELLDSSFNVIAKIDGYVPNRLLPGDYGDYLSIEINSRGVITNWLQNARLSDFEDPLFASD